MAVKAIGHRGSWFAKVGDELLPCVHAHWFKGGWYRDPGVRIGEAKWDELIEAIKMRKKVVLTNDRVSPDETGFERTGYIAVFSVDDVTVEDGELRFRFAERLEEIAN